MMNSLCVVFVIVGMVASSPIQQQSLETVKNAGHSLFLDCQTLKSWGQVVRDHFKTSTSADDVTKLLTQNQDTFRAFSESFSNMQSALQQAGVDADIVFPESNEIKQNFLATLREEMAAQETVKPEQMLGLIVGDRLGAEGVRMTLLTPLFSDIVDVLDRNSGMFQETLNELPTGNPTDQDNSYLVVLTGLLQDLNIDVASMISVYDAILATYNTVDELYKAENHIASSRHRRSPSPGGWSFGSRGLSWSRGRTTVSLGGLDSRHNRRGKTNIGGQISVSFDF